MMSARLYRMWREAHDRGLTIWPTHKRDASGKLVDHVWTVSGDRHRVEFTGDVESYLRDFLARTARDPWQEDR